MRPDFSKIDFTAPAQSEAAPSAANNSWMDNENTAMNPLSTAAALPGKEDE